MEIYILDSQWRRHKVVDIFESAIWTERWNSLGDFELDVKSTPENRAIFVEDTYLAMNHSDRVMVVETIEDRVNDSGENLISVKGRSLEKILLDRVIRKAMDFVEPWVLNRKPMTLARSLFDHICTAPAALGSQDLFPGLTQRRPSRRPYPDEEIEWIQERPGNLYIEIQKICFAYDMGFRIVRPNDSGNLYFEIYAGRDRTSEQTEVPPIIFSMDLDNIHSTTEFRSIQDAKNTAHVYTEEISTIIYPRDVKTTPTTGFNRRILLVEAQVPQDMLNTLSLRRRIGREELSKHRAQSIFEGQLNEKGTYRYRKDYILGDLVEMRNRDGVKTFKYVSEQIFVDDREGERSYPTLSIGQYSAA